MSTLLHKRRFHDLKDLRARPNCSPRRIQFLSLEDARRKRVRECSSEKQAFDQDADEKAAPPVRENLQQTSLSKKRNRFENAMETEEDQFSKRLRRSDNCGSGTPSEKCDPFIVKEVKVDWKADSCKKKKYFTEDQVQKIVQRALQDQEEKLREQYNKILNERLAEQFENFTNFNQDYVYRQMNRRACSYVS
mmetsp:Transcript_27152/g.37910  ORF Transcript_27152/g.37910 Transcript_27152/m.37910 type:complete len:192 (-) Transcript_27152:473-1048(-)|eukprot:CAMPEP_0185264004 /NCGR_PEP_ID=MMETSP1359-20130426/17030_1 /TAXON_ID=552665 /ORGANISM="Bigelowiella longifila, Strain CCMP242" /LENGTH=191 /DNA_ID=CAMNT_0027851939 /DNA_START=166 /DNA_END=741 /DNA_ORIENTATION=-